ncbi:MAG TPA: hypothetical protein VJN43_04455 [Bryobacteraceae bacterium]|nr:hypothetical protein [Bryobacteraceae bacterium]
MKMVDAAAATQGWLLTFQDLTDAEIGILLQFFATSEGRLNPFTFFDPLSNLLIWSEAIDQPIWQNGNLLQRQSGIDDPMGGSNATHLTNATAGSITLQQTINGPGWYTYCFSAYVRSRGAVPVSLQLQADAASESLVYLTPPYWQRIYLSTTLNTTAETFSAGIIIPPGQTVDAFGFQLEAQPGASLYKRSIGASGVIANAHFAQDEFTFITDAPNRHRCKLRIVSP